MYDFFEFSNEMLCVADSRGYFTRVNPAWTTALGWSAEELTSRPFIAFVHPDDVEATIREAQLLLSGTHETILFENRYRCLDGTYRWMSWQAKFAPGTKELVATARDVTVQRQQAEALREAEERFRAFMNNSPAIAWAKDEQGRLVFVNKMCEDRFHIPLADWQGKTDFDFWPQEIACEFQKNDQKVLASGVPLTVVERTVKDDSPLSYWLSIKFPFRDSLGRKFVGGIGVDITELNQAHEALKAKEELLLDLIEVQEAEKHFLCREFHDGLIQFAVGSLMTLEGFQGEYPSSVAAAAIDSVIANLKKGIDDGRRAIRGIRPAVLDDFGLDAAVDDLIDQYSTSGIMVTSKCDPAIGRLPKSVQTTVYRVVQEALNNARNHSGTDVVRIELKRSNGDLHLEVQDFGCGFDVDSAWKKGFGLRGMTERVRLLGGQCLIQSKQDAGTHISVHLPIPKDSDEKK